MGEGARKKKIPPERNQQPRARSSSNGAADGAGSRRPRRAAIAGRWRERERERELRRLALFRLRSLGGRRQFAGPSPPVAGDPSWRWPLAGLGDLAVISWDPRGRRRKSQRGGVSFGWNRLIIAVWVVRCGGRWCWTAGGAWCGAGAAAPHLHRPTGPAGAGDCELGDFVLTLWLGAAACREQLIAPLYLCI